MSGLISDVGQQVLPQSRHVMASGNYARINTLANTTVKSGPGILLGFYVASTTAGTLVLFDNTAASGTQIAGTITPSVGWNPLPAKFSTGLTVTSGGTAIDVTFVYI